MPATTLPEKPVTDASGKIRCDACPVMCYIADGKSGACDRYANVGGELTRLDPLVVLEGTLEKGAEVVPFMATGTDWDGDLVNPGERFVTAVGAGTTYPDYKPAPFIVASQAEAKARDAEVTEQLQALATSRRVTISQFLLQQNLA